MFVKTQIIFSQITFAHIDMVRIKKDPVIISERWPSSTFFLGHQAPLLKHFGSMQQARPGIFQSRNYPGTLGSYLYTSGQPSLSSCLSFYILHTICTSTQYILLTTRSPSFCAFNTRQAILVCFHSNSSLSHGIEAQSVCS